MSIAERRLISPGILSRLNRSGNPFAPQAEGVVVDIRTGRAIDSSTIAEVTNIIPLRRSLRVAYEGLDHIPGLLQTNEAAVRGLGDLVVVKKTAKRDLSRVEKSPRNNSKILNELAIVVKKVSRCIIIGGPHTSEDCPTGQAYRCRSLLNYAISTAKKAMRWVEVGSKTENTSKPGDRLRMKALLRAVVPRGRLRIRK